jgi:hypothetical protein
MEATVFNPAQQHISQEVLKNYFAKKLDEEMDKMVDNGNITAETIESWGKEHMRTSYED